MGMTSDEEKAALLRSCGWTETIYKTWQGPGWPWHSTPWRLERAYRRVTSNSMLEPLPKWSCPRIIPQPPVPIAPPMNLAWYMLIPAVLLIWPVICYLLR
jgi:hypothetical protein